MRRPTRRVSMLALGVGGILGILAAAVITQKDIATGALGLLVLISMAISVFNRRLIWNMKAEIRRDSQVTRANVDRSVQEVSAAKVQFDRAVTEILRVEGRLVQFDRGRESRTAAKFDWLARRHQQQERALEDFLRTQERALEDQAERVERMLSAAWMAEAEQAQARVDSGRRLIEAELEAIRAELLRLKTEFKGHGQQLGRALSFQRTYGTRKRLLADISALLSLYGDTSRPAPVLGDWSMAPRSLERMRREVLQLKPLNIVELGSGSSTPFLAEWARSAHSDARVVSLEHDLGHLNRTQEMLSFLALQGATVEYTPLSTVQLEESQYQWYSDIPDLGTVDMLVVDGPPGGTGPMARFPAVPMLAHTLRVGARVLLDDVDRRDERVSVEQWVSRAWSGRHFEHVENVDGLAILEVVAIEGSESVSENEIE